MSADTTRSKSSIDVSQHPHLLARKSSVFVIDQEKLLDPLRSSFTVKQVLQVGTVHELMKNSKGRVQLNAQRRIQIMLDLIKVLDAMHHETGKTHGNVSSSAVGLTSDLTPKLMVNDTTNENQHKPVDDVYDFGILMIELLTGSLQNDQSEQDDRKFGDLGTRYGRLGTNLMEDDLDPYVRESWTFNIVSELIELALLCVESKPKKRPATSNIVEELTLVSKRMQVLENYDYYM
jgi:hypothetical protein